MLSLQNEAGFPDKVRLRRILEPKHCRMNTSRNIFAIVRGIASRLDHETVADPNNIPQDMDRIDYQDYIDKANDGVYEEKGNPVYSYASRFKVCRGLSST